MNPITTLLVCGCFVAPALAQDEAKSEQAAKKAEKKDEVKERVGTLLKAIEKAGSLRCKATQVTPTPAIFKQLGRGGGDTKTYTTVVKEEGGLVCWSKEDGDQVLARHRSKWVMLDRDGDWMPCRRPTGPIWGGGFLPEPSFVANRLRHLLKKSKWKLGAKTEGEKQLRVYSTTLELDEATHLARSGALPASGGIGGMGGMIRMAIGGGAPMLPPEPERTIELELFEDPKTNKPMRLVARVFVEGGPMGNVRIAIGGAGGGVQEIEEEEEEEEGEGKKKKPATTLTLEFSAFGEATAKDLNKAGRIQLGLVR